MATSVVPQALCHTIQYIPHVTAAIPPKTKNEPENAQERSENMSFGVMASRHWFGLLPRGTMNASCCG